MVRVEGAVFELVAEIQSLIDNSNEGLSALVTSKRCRSANNRDVTFGFICACVVWIDMIAGMSCEIKRNEIAGKSTSVGVRVKFASRSALG